MKRIVLITLISVLVLLAMWWYNSGQKLVSVSDFLQFAILILLVIFGLYMGWRQLRSVKRGEPAEDELSKRMLRKAAATSYYLSLYWWVVILYINNRSQADADVLIGYGIVGMAVIFAVCWAAIRIFGLKDE